MQLVYFGKLFQGAGVEVWRGMVNGRKESRSKDTLSSWSHCGHLEPDPAECPLKVGELCLVLSELSDTEEETVDSLALLFSGKRLPQ